MSIASHFLKQKSDRQEKRVNELTEFREEFQALLSGGNEEGKKAVARAMLSQTNERKRLAKMGPIEVCKELAELIDGEFTRVDPSDPASAPIVKKEINGMLYSIVFYRGTLTFTIYNHDLYKSGVNSGIITTRNTPFGIKKALENIENKPL